MIKIKKENKINVAIIGVGNCASSLVQGIEYYKNKKDEEHTTLMQGLMHYDIGGYKLSDIKIVCAFDVDKRKIEKDLSEAIFSEPNCTKKFCDVPFLDVKVKKVHSLDGISKHMEKYFQDDIQQPLESNEIISLLLEKEVDVLINYLPVGSQIATEYWAGISLKVKCGFINAIPVFIASDKSYAKKFKELNIPIIGDDIKSQVGATIIHRALVETLIKRGAKIDSTYQLNVGGNTDFLNMTDQTRLVSKKISKTESVSSQIPYDAFVYAGPNGYIESLKDNKICHLKIDFRIFGDIPCNIDLKLSVEDSPNSAGVVIDAIRCIKLALDNNIGGVLEAPSAYFMKHPMQQYQDSMAWEMLEEFIHTKTN